MENFPIPSIMYPMTASSPQATVWILSESLQYKARGPVTDESGHNGINGTCPRTTPGNSDGTSACPSEASHLGSEVPEMLAGSIPTLTNRVERPRAATL